MTSSSQPAPSVNRSPAAVAVAAAVEGGRVASYEPTSCAPINALLACAESAGVAVSVARIGAAVRVRPTTADAAARALGVTVRPVDLTGSPDWWRGGAEPLVVQDADGTWAAIVAAGTRSVMIRTDGASSVLTPDAATSVDPSAWGFVATFPDEPLDNSVLRSFGRPRGTGRDLALLALTAAIAMVIGTLAPVLSGQIVGSLVPTGELARILVITVILVIAAAMSATTLAVSSIVAQRLTTRSSLRVTAAAYERLFRLRTAFHREHVPGELAGRIAGLESFRVGVAGALPAVASSVGMIAASLLVLVSLSMPLAAAVVALGGAVFVVAGASLPGVMRDADAYTESSLELSGLTYSMLGGIAKLRSAGAEARMLERWTFRFARQQRFVRDLNRRSVVLGIVAGLPAMLVPVLLVIGEVTGVAAFDIGEFTTATSAAAQAAGALAGLVPVAAGLASQWPTVRALHPILAEAPEPRGSAANDPGQLRGDVALDRVSFGYDPDNLVLRDVSLHVEAGSMTAIVGPSGSGKSTIVKLLLGLETPSEGSVLFDGQALDSLDRAAVLAQMGVVPQEAALVPGSILDNVLASSPHLGEEAAWAAVERAGLAADIRAMPMGMQTVVSEGASTFSGGQRQRLMMARALTHEPPIVVLDEATSALDNHSQDVVAKSIAALGSTRIVVAHRLSTVRHADRIIVVDHGRIVEQGTYDDLVAAGGLFSRLAARQVV